MDEFYDDGFEDGFEDGDFMDDSDGDFEADGPFDEDSGIEEEPRGNGCDNEFTVEDAVFIGGTMMGWGYEEGLDEVRRRKLEKKMDEDHDNRNNHS